MRNRKQIEGDRWATSSNWSRTRRSCGGSWRSAWRGELDRLDALVAADYRQRDTTLPSGRDALKEFFAGFRTAFPDLSVRVEDLVAEGDRVAAVTVSSATQRGTFSGLPPTGRHVEFRSMDLYRVADGRIVEHYGRIDELGLLEQLGVKHDLQWPGEPAPSTPRV